MGRPGQVSDLPISPHQRSFTPLSFTHYTAGKTFTLIGNIAGGGPTVLENKDRGIIPRAAEQIFARQASLDPQKVTCQVKLAILEVYQEQLKDLIGTGGSNLSNTVSNTSNVAGMSQPTLKIREQIDGTVWVEGLTELVVNTPADFNRHLMNALKRRVVGAHAMNDTSSRSHFCCIVNVHQVFHATGVKINSKIHFIDLAGSEMVSTNCLCACCMYLRCGLPARIAFESAMYQSLRMHHNDLTSASSLTTFHYLSPPRRCARRTPRGCGSMRPST